ncbi:transcriptional pleiotropic regulator of transition state genes [Paenibacillus polymyxa]
MKNTGMVRPLDRLGRIVIPKELRKTLGIEVGSPLEFYSDDGKIAIQRYVGVSCNFCGSVNNLSYYKNSFICIDCIDEMQGRPSSRDSRSSPPIPEEPKSEPKPIPKEKKVRLTQNEMIEKLRSLIQEYPNQSQKHYAQELNISQGRVSQLKKML